MDILQTFQNGVEESAARLFTEYRDRLYAAALSQCGNDHAAAEDLVMATFEVYLTKKEMFDPSKGTLLSWLMTVMHNLRCNDIHRSKRSGVVYLNPEELNLLREIREFDNSTDAEILAKSDEEEIARILETLPPKVREAMHLRFFESMPVIQIAKVLAVSPGAIRVRIHYGRKILQKRLAKAAKKSAALALALFLGLGAVFAAVKTGGFGLLSEENLPTEERSGSAPIVKCMAATVDVGSGEPVASVAGILDGDEVSTTMITGGTKMNTGKLAVAAVMASAMTINNADAATIRLSDFAVTETEVVSAKIAVTIETDEPCGLYAVYGHGDFCRTNLLDEAATSAVGREFDLANLAPGTDYSVYLYAQNPGDAVVRTEILSFSTAAEIRGFPPSTEESGKWSAAQYFSGQWRKVEGNVLAGLSTETSKGNAFQQEEQTTSKTGKELTDEIVTTTYDKSTMTAIHTDEILTWHLTEPADLQEVILISRWGDRGRDGIDVNSVEVLTVDEPGTWRTVSSEAVSARDGGGTYSVRASLKPENDNNVLAKGVTDLRIVFGSVENGFVGIEEIVAVAKADGDVAPPSAAVTGYDGEVLMLELSREGRDASAVKVYAGENYGGENSLGWTELDVGALAFAEGTGALSVTLANIPAAVRYIRLFSKKDGWMPTVLLDELTVNRDPQVKLSNFAVTETRIGGAILSVEVGSIGYGATAYDLAVVYGRDGTVVRRTLCTGSSQKGPVDLELTGLKPDAEYTVKLVASNGLAGGAAETSELAFGTEREALVIRPRFFEPVEYIESTGSQTVDTGVYPSSSTVSQMKYREATRGGGVFYGRNPDDHDDYRFFKFSGDSYFDMPGDLRLQDSTVLGSGVNEVELGNYYILNMLTGKRIDQGTILDFESRDYTLGLFDANDYGDVYWLRIFEGGELVRDFIPVQDAAGDGFLFDLVNGNRAENDGTAPLLVGPALKSVQVESCVRSGDSVSVGLSLRGFVGATELAACVGNVYGGEDLVNWTSAETFELFGGVIYTTIAFPRERIADWTYLRFNSADLGWSQTIMVEEIPEKTAGGLRVVEVGQPIATADDAALTVTLDDGGAGIVGDVFAVTAFQYFNGTAATIITQTNRVLKTVGAGEYAVSLKNLCPQSRYELSFLVTTASGTEVFPAKEPLALVTDAEAYPDGSPRLSVVTGPSKSGKLLFTVTCPTAAEKDVTLYAAYGKSYGGDDPTCWGHVEAIGAVWEADEAVLSSQTPAMGRSTTYLRFFTSDGRWSNTVFIPAIGFHPKQGFAVILR